MPPTLSAAPDAEPVPDLAALNALLAPYKEPSLPRSAWQLAGTVALLAACWSAMHLALARGWWPLLIVLAVPAAGLLMRLFCIQHDCGHGSFFKSSRANDLVGGVIGVLTLTPYRYWRQTHAIHHATSGSLDRRGWGDIDTRTVAEYKAMRPAQRRWYRLYRSAPVLFLVGPVFHFVVHHRLTAAAQADWRAERLSILRTDLALATLALVADRTIGLGPFLAIFLSTGALAAIFGVWLFYVQHQFEEGYWRRDDQWDFATASLEGSSYFALPRLLQWFTANIGFHHIHHLNSRIPNYQLERCMAENAVFQRAKRLTLLGSLRCARLALWDEQSGRMVGFDAVTAA